MNFKNAPLKEASSQKNTINFIDNFSIKWIVLVLVFVNALLYINTLNFGFSSFDDDAILLSNEQFLSDFSNIKYAVIRDAEFQKQRIELYRPLQNCSYFLDVALFSFSSKGFHFTNLVLHLFNLIALFFLLLQLKFEKTFSFVGTLLYSVHPMFAFTVSWLPSRGDLLLSLFGLLSLIAFLKYLESRKNRFILFHLLFFTLALLSKESALVLAPISWLYAYFISPKFKLTKWMIISWFFYIIIVIVYFYMRKISIAPTLHAGFGLSSFFYNSAVFPESFLKFVLPFNIPLLPFYDFYRSLFGSVLLLAFFVLCLIKIKNRQLAFWALSFLFALLLPSMMYKPEWSNYIYDYLVHRNYLPFVGLLIIFLQLLKTYENKIKPSVFIASFIIVLLFFSALTFSLSSAFASPNSFWAKAVKLNPKSAFAQNYYGNALQSNGDYLNALNAYDASIKLKNNYSDVYLNRGVCLMKLNNQTEAISSFSACLMLDKNNIQALKYRASAYLQIKDHLRSRADLTQLILIEPNNQENYYNRALGYFLLKDYSHAVTDFSVVLGSDSTNMQVFKFLAFCYLQLDKPESALNVSLRWTALLPNDNEAINNLAYANWELDNFSEAQKLFMRVYEKDSLNLDAFLGLILCQSKNTNSQTSSLIVRDIHKFGLLNTENKLDTLEKVGFIFTKKQKNVLIKAL